MVARRGLAARAARCRRRMGVEVLLIFGVPAAAVVISTWLLSNGADVLLAVIGLAWRGARRALLLSERL
ncbi:hypothetical protein GCM10009559_62000 [Pseudonocardia zijingensis]|uniref:Uncharacterized protein n=2 Tax=Pseudonocardia zijingensis TaxID=153376 RepID=A0ABN1N9K6_9PSEU